MPVWYLPFNCTRWSQFLQKKQFRERLTGVLPHDPTSPNAYDPADVGLGFIGGILCGADKVVAGGLVGAGRGGCGCAWD